MALDDEEDLEYGYCAYAFLLSVRKFMKEIGFENEWLTIVTPTFDIEGGFEFRFSKVDKEWLKQLPDPIESLRMLNQVKDIEERARMHSEEMLDFVQLVNFIIQSFRCADTIYSGVKPFSTIYWFNLAVLVIMKSPLSIS